MRYVMSPHLKQIIRTNAHLHWWEWRCSQTTVIGASVHSLSPGLLQRSTCWNGSQHSD